MLGTEVLKLRVGMGRPRVIGTARFSPFEFPLRPSASKALLRPPGHFFKPFGPYLVEMFCIIGAADGSALGRAYEQIKANTT
jgi:hypothetical protein